MPVVPVHIPGAASYEITVRAGLLDEAGVALRKISGSGTACVVTDSTVGTKYLQPLQTALSRADFKAAIATISPGEDNKTIATVDRLYSEILQHKIDRQTPIIALGGGVVGDTAGFVAATILRGVPLVQIPTTLLAMVDASVGGKTGVNHAVGKNLIGAFHQPLAVLIDPNVLTTLPPCELRGGLAECIKHEIIRDAQGFTQLEQNISRAVALDIDFLTDLIAHNVAIKARVVEADPFEKGDRAHLNFGHTFGHAIETVSSYSYSHGESVALGMCAASFTATKHGLLDDGSRQRISRLIEKAGLPTRGLNLDTDAVVNAMGFDKKVKGGKLRFVLPDRIGHVMIRDDVPAELMKEAVQSLRG